MCLIDFEYFLPKWLTLGMPGQPQPPQEDAKKVTSGSAGIFSALSYFVAETPTMFYTDSTKILIQIFYYCSISFQFRWFFLLTPKLLA